MANEKIIERLRAFLATRHDLSCYEQMTICEAIRALGGTP